MRVDLIYEDRPRYDLWLRLLLGGILLIVLAVGLWLVTVDLTGAAVMFGIIVFDGALFYFIMPRRYEIRSDRLVVALGRPFSITIPFSDIKGFRAVSGGTSMVYGGMKLATSTKYVVEIQRYKGLNVIISPSNGDLFMEQLNHAMKSAGRS